MSLPEVARALLALPPDRFVAERDALARELAARGDRAAADVKKLRRPVGLAWVLNHLARERADEVEKLLRAGDRLRAGHRRAVAGGGPGELREAEEELRARARALRSEAARVLEGAGRPADPAVLSRLELLLRLVAPVPGPERDALRAGALATEPRPASDDVGGLAVIAGGASEASGRRRAAAARAAGRAEELPPRPAEAGARDPRREAARRAREAKRAEAEAARRRKDAQREADRAEAAARRAEGAAARAEELARRTAEKARALRAEADAARADAARRRESAGRVRAP